jgi:DNA polymerase IIIc chi subunit
VAKIIPEVERCLGELGAATDDDGEQHPRTVVAECLTYLRNQQSRMHYAEYRRQGLPITTATWNRR